MLCLFTGKGLFCSVKVERDNISFPIHGKCGAVVHRIMEFVVSIDEKKSHGDTWKRLDETK